MSSCFLWWALEDCLESLALNVSTCFASELPTLCKNTPHSARSSLEPSNGFSPSSAHKKNTLTSASLNGAPDGIVLDFLHARKVSLMDLRFKSAQFPRYPNFATLNTYGNPPNSQKRFSPLSIQPLKKNP